MKFNLVNKRSDRPVHQQLREQIISRISTGELNVGDEMPAVRTVARQLRVSVNTVSSVYHELVREEWLVAQPGRHHIVISHSPNDDSPTKFAAPDQLVNHIVKLALKNGYSLAQVVARLRKRLLDQPPDHLLIVEPEPQVGELIREEIRQNLGVAPIGCSLETLEQDPSKSIGAVLLTPIYLQDRLDFLPPPEHQTVTLFYSSPDKYATLVRDLPRSSAVGMVSISPAILKTFGDNIADAIGERHTAQTFLMEWPIGKSGPRFRPVSNAAYESIQVRKQTEGSVHSHNPRIVSGSGSEDYQEDQPWFSGNLDFVDILFCDSIAYKAVKHSQAIPCQLLSSESLKAVEAKLESLR